MLSTARRYHVDYYLRLSSHIRILLLSFCCPSRMMLHDCWWEREKLKMVVFYVCRLTAPSLTWRMVLLIRGQQKFLYQVNIHRSFEFIVLDTKEKRIFDPYKTKDAGEEIILVWNSLSHLVIGTFLQLWNTSDYWLIKTERNSIYLMIKKERCWLIRNSFDLKK